MDNISRYEKYSKIHLSEMKKSAEIRGRYLADDLKRINPAKVLELGCGEGSLGFEIKKILVNSEIYGVDASLGSLKLAKKKGLIVKKADLNKGIPYESKKFDLVFSNQLIEHIENTDFLLQESLRVLKPGGYFIVITPNLSFWLNRLIFLFGIYPIFLEVSRVNKTFGMRFLKNIMFEKETVGHIRVFNLPALLDMLNFYGFKTEKVAGIPFPFKMPKILGIIYNTIDFIFSKRPSLARDIMIIAKK